MPSVVSTDIPSEVALKLKDLENDFLDGDLTKKGFCKKKWQLLEPHLPAGIVEQVHSVQKEFATTDLSENDYCDKILYILKLNASYDVASNDIGNSLKDGKKLGIITKVLANEPSFIGECPIDHEEEIDETNGHVGDKNYEGENPSHKKCNSLNNESSEAMEVEKEVGSVEKIISSKCATENLNKPESDSKEFTSKCTSESSNAPVDEKQVKTDSESEVTVTVNRDLLDQNSKITSDVGACGHPTIDSKENYVSSNGSNGLLSNGTKKTSDSEIREVTDSQKNSASYSQKSMPKSSSRKANSNSGLQKSNQTSLISLFQNATKRKVKEEIDEGSKIDASIDNDPHLNLNKKIKMQEQISIDVNGNCGSMTKEVKTEDENKMQPNVLNKKPKIIPQKCPTCLQLLDDPDLKLYQGHPHGAVEEFIALTDPRLSLFTGNEENLVEGDERPHNKLTCFSIYDKAGHLCPFDTGLIERNVLLYFSGYIKAIYEESSDIEGGVPTKDMGPINEWWVSGFDGGELALVGFSTAYGEYYLMEPSDDYAPYMEAVKEKIFLSKLVIEFLVDEINPKYEDLLNKLQTTVPPKGITRLSEDSLLRHAQFVCDQVLSFDSSALAHEDLLITSPCMRALVKLSGVTIGKRIAMRRAERKDFKVSKPIWTKATTTELVQLNFESYFTGQLDAETEAKQGPRRRRCGVCEACQHPDCGTCIACLDMVKYGGTGRGKQACVKRRCPNMAIEEAEDDDLDEELDSNVNEEVEEKRLMLIHKKVRVHKETVTWVGPPVKEDKNTFYVAVKIGGIEYFNGDFVMLEPTEPGVPFVVCRILYMWEDKKGNKYFHGQFYCRATDTVLGDTADPHELYLIDACEDYLLGTIAYKANVVHTKTSENWRSLGGEKLNLEDTLPDDGKSFFYQKWYDPRVARFEDPKPILCNNKEKEHMFCSTCKKLILLRETRMPSMGEILEKSDSEVKHKSVMYCGNEYSVGTSIFLKPTAFTFKTVRTTGTPFSAFKMLKVNDKQVDEDIYPEYYRKSDGTIKGSNEETPKPFCIGHIVEIFVPVDVDFPLPQDVRLRVIKFYRPENTHKGLSLSYQADLNMVYWTDEETEITLSDVVRPCFVGYGENINEPIIDWIKKGPNRFYFNQAYNSSSQSFEDPPCKATRLGGQGKGKGKGKGKGRKTDVEEKKNVNSLDEWPKIPNKLKCLDVFAGCGGLSEGLHEAGVAETCWAIEKEEAAANAFKLNNPHCTVFADDCNLLLKLVLNGEKTNEKGQILPQKGDVDLLCGGPPCQGFSGMNRFNSREYSKFKNSLIVSYLSYCDYFRPKYFILENVRNFVSFKNSIILKLTLRCLLRMGYQCTFGILQAGNYGVPQTRRRLIILAAAPGFDLPMFPEPTHVFNLRASQLSCVIDGRKYVSNCHWLESAPYRTITVRDSMSDLPEIRNGHRKDEMSYGGEPMSFFQRLMRGNQYQPILRDHICKQMAPIVEARISNIPTEAGSDWRDLPNIVVRLSDGTFTKKLLYTHHHKKNGKSSTGAFRGVCICASGTGKACDPMDRQYNTLIPWCLPHTGNRHNHWAGLYGRLEWDGFFSTTVTNPEPMGKQGRVLHPEQSRVVSVRECARSQGFRDTYRFFGNILEKHRQVGNAVPPPMGAAIGYEIRNSYFKSVEC